MAVTVVNSNQLTLVRAGSAKKPISDFTVKFR